jgi:enterochelin esterase family protein
VLDRLVYENHIPQTVALLHDNRSNAERSRELVFSNDFNAFLKEELLAFARDEWSAGIDERMRVVGGASAGGLAALYAAFCCPTEFPKVISLIGALGMPRGGSPNWLIDQYARRDRLPLRLFLEAGLLDNDAVGPMCGMLDANRRMADVLMSRGYDFDYRERAGGHDWITIQESLGEGLVRLLGHSIPQ